MKRVTSPMSAKKLKQRKMDNGADGMRSPNSDHVNLVVVEVSKIIVEKNGNAFQQRSDFEAKKQHTEALIAEREKLKIEKAHLLQQLHEKNGILTAAKERSKEIFKKVAEYKKKTQQILEQKTRVIEAVKKEEAVVHKTMEFDTSVGNRMKQVAADAVRLRDTVIASLEKAEQKLKAAEDDQKDHQAKCLAALEKRKQEWQEMTVLLENKRSEAEALRSECDKSQKKLDGMKEIAADKKRQIEEINEKSRDLKEKLEYEHKVAADKRKLASITNECEISETQLESLKSDLQKELRKKQMECEEIVSDVRQDQIALTNFEEQERLESEYHNEKLRTLKNALEEKLRALQKFEEEAKTAEEERRLEWEKKKKQQTEKLDAQQKCRDELKRDFERLTGEIIDSDSFELGCREVKQYAAKIKEDRERLLSEIELMKQRAKENELTLKKPASSSKTLKESLSQPQLSTATAPSISAVPKKLEMKHVTFKSTPTFYDPPSSQAGPPPPPIQVPVTPRPLISALKPISPKTPSPKKARIGPPMAPKSESKQRFTASSKSQWSDDSFELDCPRATAVLRRPLSSKRSTKDLSQDDIFGIF